MECVQTLLLPYFCGLNVTILLASMKLLTNSKNYLGSSKVLNRTDKKENEIFLIYKEILMGSVAKSYMREGLPNI